MASLAEATTFIRKRLNSAVGRNVVSLYVLQIGNYVVPLATVPYLVRVLGPEKFGLVAFGQGLMAYFSLIVNFGFDWSGTRKIAVQRGNTELVNQTAANVWGAKALLSIGTALLLWFLVRSVPRLHAVALLMIVLYSSILGGVLFPTWLFQGLERMSAISIVNLSLRAAGAVAIFIWIHHPADFLLYAGIVSAQGIIAGIAGFVVGFRMFGLRLAFPTWRGIWREMSDSTPFFFTTAAISLYTSGNAFILGLLTNPVAVGYYSAGEKVITAASGLLGPLSQAVFPKFSRLAQESRTQSLLWARKMLALTGIGSSLMSAFLFLGAPFIVHVLFGPKYADSAAVIAIMSPLPFLVAVSNVLGVQVLFPFGYEKGVLAIVLAAGIVNITLAYFFAPRWQSSGMATAVVISETVVALGFFACTWFSNLNPLDTSS